MKYLLLIAVLLLSACAETVDVSGGTVNTLDIRAETLVIGITSTGSHCEKMVLGNQINDGVCKTPLIVYPAGEYSIAELKAKRDLTLYPYDAEELLFLGK